ncbi:MAG TPA: DUF3857 domain-containing protein [Acidisarcina sp.]
MTSQPEAPGAIAVYLFREEITEDREGSNSDTMDAGTDRLNYQSVYVRLKILTEEGKRYGDVVVPYYNGVYSMGVVQGRTIHSDGSVVPFAGKPFQKVVQRGRGNDRVETVFAMPDVQVGSILEYRYFLRYNSGIVVPPIWYVHQELFLRNGHYYFRPTGEDVSGAHSSLTNSNGVAYTMVLPPGAAVKDIFSQHAYELNVHNVPPLPEEEWAPPLHSISYRVLFYYTQFRTADAYWASEGRYWSKDVDRFTSSSKLNDSVAQMVGATDTDRQKVNKIYDAVMLLENTDFTRQHGEAENRSAGIKTRTADDIWAAKRGSSDEITLLFIALVRAAGLNAYAMAVTNRDHALFSPGYMTFQQLDDYVAIVSINGKDQFFDPGERYCTFGQLHWTHTMSGGVRQSGGGGAVAQTPGFGYEDAETVRAAQLEIAADGKLKGIIKIRMTGPAALYWRQRALRTDEAAVSREFEQRLQQTLPGGVEVKLDHFVALADWKTDLSAVLSVTGGMGSSSAKRLFLPSSFFEASEKPLFVSDKREGPIDLHYPSLVQDTVALTLPKGAALESVPKDMRAPLPKNALYSVKYPEKPGTYTQVRVFILANPFYQSKDYPDLKDFYQKVNAQDQQQIVLTYGAAASGQ